MTTLGKRLVTALQTPTDPAGLAVFRFLFGALVALGSARFLDSGWPEKLYGTPSFFFRYAGFAFVPGPDADSARAVYVAFIVLGIGMAVGALYRVCVATFVVLFAWVQLGDVTNYLNHYWLVILLGALLVVVPAHATWSVDAWWFGSRRATVPFAAVFVLRFQIACVYVFAAVAKIGPDWLVLGQPLGVWLPARSSLPVIGPLLLLPWVPLAASWVGFLYDAAIVPLLLWRRTRGLAWLAVVVFHGLTSVFFAIGMFPFIMTVATTLLFAPDWPRAFVRRRGPAWLVRIVDAAHPVSSRPTRTRSIARRLREGMQRRASPAVVAVVVAVWCTVQVALPLRTLALGGDVLWDEAGMRWSWRVMVREKSGSLAYRVRFHDARLDDDAPARTVFVNPHDWLTWRQVNEMVGQPDLILQLAHAIRDDFVADGHRDVAVFADSRVTLNGRPPAPFIDPDVDLATVADCLLCRPTFVLPPPTSAPPSPWRTTPAVPSLSTNGATTPGVTR
jgi:hypothetical protein